MLRTVALSVAGFVAVLYAVVVIPLWVLHKLHVIDDDSNDVDR